MRAGLVKPRKEAGVVSQETILLMVSSPGYIMSPDLDLHHLVACLAFQLRRDLWHGTAD